MANRSAPVPLLGARTALHSGPRKDNAPYCAAQRGLWPRMPPRRSLTYASYAAGASLRTGKKCPVSLAAPLSSIGSLRLTARRLLTDALPPRPAHRTTCPAHRRCPPTVPAGLEKMVGVPAADLIITVHVIVRPPLAKDGGECPPLRGSRAACTWQRVGSAGGADPLTGCPGCRRLGRWQVKLQAPAVLRHLLSARPAVAARAACNQSPS